MAVPVWHACFILSVSDNKTFQYFMHNVLVHQFYLYIARHIQWDNGSTYPILWVKTGIQLRSHICDHKKRPFVGIDIASSLSELVRKCYILNLIKTVQLGSWSIRISTLTWKRGSRVQSLRGLENTTQFWTKNPFRGSNPGGLRFPGTVSTQFLVEV